MSCEKPIFCQQMLAFQEGLGLWYLTSHSTIFQLYCGSQFYWWRKLEYPENITDKLNHILLYRLHMVVGFMQLLPITTKVVSSNPAHGKV
jgi:hypothetical protein